MMNPSCDIQPQLKQLDEKKLVGLCRPMSITDNQTAELWRSFMPRRKEILHPKSTGLYAVEIYPPGYFAPFSPDKTFEKWAAVEVTHFDVLPPDMQAMVIPAGLYAVFLYKGPASAGAGMYRYIFTTWLPQSQYLTDQRPHFAFMDERYKGEDPASEEELWIPVRPKQT